MCGRGLPVKLSHKLHVCVHVHVIESVDVLVNLLFTFKVEYTHFVLFGDAVIQTNVSMCAFHCLIFF